jgi:hypothetical protein
VVYLRRYADSGSLDVGHRLADLNTTVVGLVKGTMSVTLWCLLRKKKEKNGLGKVGDFRCWAEFLDWKVQLGDHQIENKPASESVEELPVCRAQV